MDRRKPAAAPLAHRRARTVRGVGDAERRAVDNAEHRLAILDEGDEHREFAVADDKFPRAVERVDQPEARRRTLEPGLRHGLFRDDRDVGEGLAQHVEDDPLGGEIGLGERRLVVLFADVERIGVDSHRRLAAGNRGAQCDLQEPVAHGAVRPSRRRWGFFLNAIINLNLILRSGRSPRLEGRRPSMQSSVTPLSAQWRRARRATPPRGSAACRDARSRVRRAHRRRR